MDQSPGRSYAYGYDGKDRDLETGTVDHNRQIAEANQTPVTAPTTDPSDGVNSPPNIDGIDPTFSWDARTVGTFYKGVRSQLKLFPRILETSLVSEFQSEKTRYQAKQCMSLFRCTYKIFDYETDPDDSSINWIKRGVNFDYAFTRQHADEMVRLMQSNTSSSERPICNSLDVDAGVGPTLDENYRTSRNGNWNKLDNHEQRKTNSGVLAEEDNYVPRVARKVRIIPVL